MGVLNKLSPQQLRVPLSEGVYRSIREAIIGLTFEPGQLIYENELGQSLGVSRTPVREAIRSLVNEELLEVLPQRGTQVAYVSEKKVLETRFIRAQLELGAFRIVAEQWTPDGNRVVRQQLEHVLDNQQAAADADDIALFLQLDEEFHRLILEVAGNATLMSVVYHMRGHLNRLRYLAIREGRSMQRVITEHKQIFQAIQMNDVERVTTLLDAHVGRLNDEIPELRVLFPHYFSD